jgi:hypothetical protein
LATASGIGRGQEVHVLGVTAQALPALAGLVVFLVDRLAGPRLTLLL